MAFVLASQSPRRQELLRHFHIDFVIRPADIDETLTPGLSLRDAVGDISRRKALAVPRQKEDTVIAADTIVVLGDRVLGKPRDEEDAFRMLRLLSGSTHRVMTGLTVVQGEDIHTCTEVTDVTFRPLSDEEIRGYIASGEPMDKAGAYGIQGDAALFVSGISGDYYNVVGLPLCRLAMILQTLAEKEKK